ncbi:MAG TPA: hypothetical protein VHN13_23215 [Candidatus Tectomicrobia bacterium]|nr:hypothetical protein [Candidatus Tectomicrobia bacterium]
MFGRRSGEIQLLKADGAASPIFHQDYLIPSLLSDKLVLRVTEPDG